MTFDIEKKKILCFKTNFNDILIGRQCLKSAIYLGIPIVHEQLVYVCAWKIARTNSLKN